MAGGKARLGGALDAEEREELVLGMLRHTLLVLAAWPACARVHVVSPDERLLRLVRSGTVDTVIQPGDGLNEGLLLGRHAAIKAGARSLLILPADLPLLEVASLERLLDAADAALAAGSGSPLVVIGPSDARNGTNALLLAPSGVIDPAFGISSFEAHVRAAATADASLQVVTDAGLGFDLDTPEDVEVLRPDTLEALLRLGQELAAPGPSGS
jgi:2-phospho-L-lactate guanylyltransferase